MGKILTIYCVNIEDNLQHILENFFENWKIVKILYKNLNIFHRIYAKIGTLIFQKSDKV